MNPSYGIIIWLILGAIVGWTGHKITQSDASQTPVSRIFVGMFGAAVGGYLARILGDAPSNNGVLMTSIVAFGGAWLAILVWTTLERRRYRAR